MAGTARGSLATAAKRVGVSAADYAQRIVLGEKWCTGCKAWHLIDDFGADGKRLDGRASSCLEFRRRNGRERYVPKPPGGRLKGFYTPAREGDKLQARRRVNYLVEQGRIQHPNELPCTDCGHVWDGQRRHEYDHAQGYRADTQLHVEAVCSMCHHARERRRATP